jgi:hypothetical protein
MREQVQKEVREQVEAEMREQTRQHEKQTLLRMLQKKFGTVKNGEVLVEKIKNTVALEPLFEEILDIDDARQMERLVKAAAKVLLVQ